VQQARSPKLHDGEHSTGAFCTGTKLEQLFKGKVCTISCSQGCDHIRDIGSGVVKVQHMSVHIGEEGGVDDHVHSSNI